MKKLLRHSPLAWKYARKLHEWLEQTFIDELNCPHREEPLHRDPDCPWCSMRFAYRINRWLDAEHKAEQKGDLQ